MSWHGKPAAGREQEAIMSQRCGCWKLLETGVLLAGLTTAVPLAAQEASHPDTPLGHALQVDAQEHAGLAARVPQSCRDRFHIFFVNGMDPLGAANFRGLCGYVQGQGYSHAYYGQMTQGNRVTQHIRDLRKQDPEAHLVLVGFSAGTYVVRDVALALKADGIPVDLLVYIGGDYLQNSADSRPANVRKIVNITGHGFLLSGGDLLFNGTTIDGAVNVRVPCRHMLLPSRRETIDVLLRELTASCQAAFPSPPRFPGSR
jgi:pimeloyl-ACP methyl ester carboxylesterase